MVVLLFGPSPIEAWSLEVGRLLVSCVVGSSSCDYYMTSVSQSIYLGTSGCCSGANFYDSGGPLGNYSDNENETITFVAPMGQQVWVQFSSFSTESGFDSLYVYDGLTTSSRLIGAYSGTVLSPTLTSTGGSLTFLFVSNGSGVSSEWAATVKCVTCTPPTATSSSSSPVCRGSALQLRAAVVGCGPFTYLWTGPGGHYYSA